MAVVFNHMQSWLYSSTKLTPAAKLLLQRMVSLSKEGEITVFVKREQIASELGLSVKTLSRSFHQLVSQNLIIEVDNPDPYDRRKYFDISPKAFLDKEGQNVSVDRDKMSDKMSDDKDKMSITQDKMTDKMSLSSLDKKESKKEKEEEEKSASAPLTFDSVFSQMVKINEEEFTPKGIPFTEEDIRSDARTYTLKFKGKPTRDSMVKWMTAGDERRSEQRKLQSESNQISTVQLPRKMTAAEIRAGLAKYEERFGHPGSPFYRGDPDYES